MDYKFTDLVDIDAFSNMLKSFYDATGILHGLVDADNNVISAVGWQEACTDFHRIFPICKQRCEESNRCLAEAISTQTNSYVGGRCLNGLMDYATPIVIEEEQVATLYFGQILHQPPDLDFFRRQARECGLDEEAYLEAIRKVPVIPLERVEPIMSFFTQLAQMLAQSGLDRMREQETEKQLEKLNRELAQRVEERTRELAAKNRELAADITLRRQVEQYNRARNKVLELIATGSALTETLNTLIHNLEEENPATLGSILLLDADGRHLHTGAAPSLPEFYNRAIDGIEIGEAVGSCGTAAYTQQQIIVADIQNHPYWEGYRDLASRAGLAACWSEPVFSSQGNLIGTFALYSRKPSEPTEHDLYLIEQAAHLASIAIEHQLALEELERRAHTDSLTGLANRGRFFELADVELARSLRYGNPYTVLLLDIDHFKAINDIHGHKTGDTVLQVLASIMRKTLREVDIIGRIGGEEFAILLPETDMETAPEVAERLRKAVADTEIPIGSQMSLRITVSIGVALPIKNSHQIDIVLRRADAALYSAKNKGRNRVCVADAA